MAVEGAGRRKGGGSLIKRNLLARRRENARTPELAPGVRTFMTDPVDPRRPAYICAREIGLMARPDY